MYIHQSFVNIYYVRINSQCPSSRGIKSLYKLSKNKDSEVEVRDIFHLALPETTPQRQERKSLHLEPQSMVPS